MNEIIEKARRGEATADELGRLAAWRAADAVNERQYREIMTLLETATELRSELAAASPPSAAELLARFASAQDLPRHAIRPATRPATRPGTRSVPTLVPTSAPAGAGRRSSGWRRQAPWAIAAAAVLVMVATLVPSLIDRGVPAPHAADVVTGAGEIVTVQLADGSAVRLAPSSRLRLGEDGDPRSVTLDGRAFFSIAKVEGRPFRVRTRAGTATVLGTRFELVARDDDLRLVVVDGRVALETPENRVEVSAGQVSAVSNRIAAAPTAASDVGDVLRWTGKFLAFQDTPLREAAREIAATYGVPVTIADATLARQTVTAVFTGQSLAAVVDVICTVVHASCQVHPDRVVISPR
jgi:transmembrane sensor